MDFEYKTVDSAGKALSGAISASDFKEAKFKLRERGFVVLDLTAKERTGEKRRLVRKRIADQDIYDLAKELSILLRSGMKIDAALRVLIDSTLNQELKEALSQLLKDVSSGKGMARSLAETGKFSPLVVTTIQVGESVGDLKTAFENIATYMRFQINFKNEIRNAMTYPMFLIFASLMTLAVIFKFIVPRFFSIFGQASVASLPLPSRMLYSMSGALTLVNLVIFIALIAGAVVLGKTRYFKGFYHSAYASIIFFPLIGRLVLYLELSRFSYSMFSMLNSGVEFIKALDLSAGLIQNRHLRDSIEPSIGQIKEGKKIADVFSQIPLLPNIVPNMIAVGEGSGNLKEIFLELHQIFDERFKNAVKKVLILIEPVIITITGLIVGFIVISLILTVMGVSNIKL